MLVEINFIINDLIKKLKQAHFKLSGVKLERVKTVLDTYISDGYAISDLTVFHRANLVSRCQDDRHIKFNIKKDDEEEKIEISIEAI